MTCKTIRSNSVLLINSNCIIIHSKNIYTIEFILFKVFTNDNHKSHNYGKKKILIKFWKEVKIHVCILSGGLAFSFTTMVLNAFMQHYLVSFPEKCCQCNSFLNTNDGCSLLFMATVPSVTEPHFFSCKKVQAF